MTDPTSVVIYHNPKCSTSRKVLELIRAQGIEPTVIEFLKTPLSRAELADLLGNSQTSIRDHMRKKAPAYTDLDLSNASVTDDQILDAMAEHPVLMERPVVKTAKGTRLCRPVETVLELLP